LSLRVLYDHEAFIRHGRSGITRYLSELIREFRAHPDLGIDPVTPYRWVANGHLAEGLPGYTRIPLPRSVRAQILRRLNARRVRRAADGADLVHHSVYEEPMLEAWRARRRISTIYDFTFERFPDLLPEWRTGHLAAKALFIERCDVLICISQTTRDDLLRFHPGLDKPLFVVPLGVGDEFFEPVPARIRGLPDRYLLYVGNRYPHKNVDLLLRAFGDLFHDHPDLHLVLVGAYLPTETARLEELGIADRTIRLRGVSDQQLPWLYHRAEAFVFPSRYEGFGLPVLEAMAAGCPVAMSDTPALLEVGSDVTLIFEPDDSEETLAQQIERLISDRALAESLRGQGRQRAREFTWSRTAELTVAAYRQALAS
jgi:glycosyltransferase involved in cell wall biosynthesis